MLNSEQGLQVALTPGSIHEIERFTDRVCNNLYINETYYGNILMTLTNLFELCLEAPSSKSIEISYSTDYQVVTINIEPVSVEMASWFADPADVGEDDHQARVFLVRKLSDGVLAEAEQLTVRFDISAMHNKVYSERMKHLNTYLTQYDSQLIQKKDD